MRKAGIVGAVLGMTIIGSYAAAATARQDRDPYLAMNTVLVANGCSNCHAADYLRVGPAMTDIATFYADAKPEDLAAMRHNIIAGTKGKWGIAIMPAQQRITPQRATEIAAAIMALNRKTTK